MNSTERKLADAQRQLESIRAQRLSVKQQIGECRERLGADFQAVADGAEIPEEQRRELGDLLGKEAALESMDVQAEKAVRRASDVAFARGILISADGMKKLLIRHEELSRKVDAAIDALAIAGDELRENGHQILENYRVLRGRNSQTLKGYVVTGVGALATGDQLNFLIGGGLAYRTRWFRHERPMHFLPSALSSLGALQSEFNELMGLSSLSKSAIAEARADLALDGAPLQLCADIVASAAEDIDFTDISDFQI